MEIFLEGLLVCVIGAPLNGRFVCEGEQMGVKRTRKEQDFLEERIHIVWTASPSFLLHVNEQEMCIVSYYFPVVF
jgi:hypothetical protein